ncbi:MAG: hypothetical protein CMH55_08285 [Myxococcales bacterium]|nr:hypothetical protein [Myxococcales bacterium]
MTDIMDGTGDSTVVTVISGVSRGLLFNDEACLVVVYGEEVGRRLPMGRQETVIGRSRECDIQLRNDSASRRHASVFVSPDGYMVRDLGSTNGTAVNDQPVTESLLSDGDELRLGRTVMRFLCGKGIEGKYQDLLVDVAREDGLTGAAKRVVFNQCLDNECARARRYGRGVSVAVLELRNFEEYVERVGRIWADLRLRKVSRVLSRTLRTNDLLARIGEARFALLLPETGPEDAKVCLERLFEDVRMALDEQPVIGGVSSAMGKGCVSLSIMGAADEALQKAQTVEGGIAFIAVT